MNSKVYRYTAFIIRKPANALFLLILCTLLVFGWTYINSLKLGIDLDHEQSVLDYIATNLGVKLTAGDTVPTALEIHIKLSNTGPENISFGQWRIYFYMFGVISAKETAGFELQWENGGLHYFSPIKDQFKGIPAGESIRIVIKGYKSAARSNHFPNWYVASSTYGVTSPRTIESTKDESLSFVSDFVTPVQWKRHEFDLYNPYTPEERYKLYEQYNYMTENKPTPYIVDIIPTPLSVKTISSRKVVFDRTWVIVKETESENLLPSRFLAKRLGLKVVSEPTINNFIEFKSDKSLSTEQYQIDVKSDKNAIIITSNSAKGAFYGVQSLISMLETSKSIPEVTINDKPRFSHRGFMLDVSRNFHKKETVKKLIDVMAMYKMNRLHLHLTDDEGWRIEMPSIPELTMYGSRRCHYAVEEKCLIPSLGSGPFPSSSGSGFYSVADFREILRYAEERYIQIIPEIDIPGHALSAILAMQFRELDLQSQEAVGKRSSYILSDDVSGIPSVQSWLGNSMNPCLNASYRFVDTVLADLQMIYEGVQTLDIVHVGGDEVPRGVWKSSEACQSVFHGRSLDHNTIKKMFVFTIADIAHRRGLKISAWEDGVYGADFGPYKVKDFKQEHVYVNAWNNIWTSGIGGRAIEFADGGYKVILSMATHLYFDHPYEPDPEERGLYWASRYTDTFNVFGFIPMDIFANAEYDSNGNTIDLMELCGGTCPQFSRPENIAGMEACLWSETVRNETQLFSMAFPRLLAFAERAWHKADWETITSNENRRVAKTIDFKRFINILGKKELSRIEKAGVTYRIPPPGILLSEDNKSAKINTLYPGHEIMASFGNDRSWRTVNNEINIPEGVSDIHVHVLSPVLKRKSRSTSIHLKNNATAMYFRVTLYFICIIVTLFPL